MSCLEPTSEEQKILENCPLLDLLSNVNMSRICFFPAQFRKKELHHSMFWSAPRLKLDQVNLAKRVKGPFLAGLCLIAIS